jgi:hypothetical protein
MKKFFSAQNVGEPIAGCQFERYAITGGTAFGVYATESQPEISRLEALALSPKSSVRLIDEVEYLACLKKKPRDSQNLRTLNVEPNPGASIRTPTAAVVETPPPQEIAIPTAVVAAEDVLRVAAVDVPTVPPAPETP